LSVVPLLTAITYLLLVGVGFVGALLLLVWLFRETSTGTTTGRETTRSMWNAELGEEGTPSTLAEIKTPEDRAA
jgi:hypothetical protein